VFERLLTRLGWLAIPLLPRWMVVGLARGVGDLAWRGSASERRIALANLEIAFGAALSPAQRQSIGRASFQNFALTILDVFWFDRQTAPRIRKYVRWEEGFEFALKQPPVIGVTGHIGNWEMISIVCGLCGAPMTAVAMPLKNPYVDDMLNRLRRRTGSATLPRAGALRGLLKALKTGRTVALVLDQNTLPAEGGDFVPFFGVPAPVSKAAGLLWQRSAVPIMVADCTADRRGHYTIHCRPLFPESGESCSPEQITQRAVEELETLIRLHPQHWVWAYKRWRWRPANEPASRYPFYAQPHTLSRPTYS
jgi:Kdo2-lipid IVA lauroyltransferase/acyltransferase